MEVILDSKKCGSFCGAFCGRNEDFDVYAEVCKLSNLSGSKYIARIVECPENLPDKIVRRVELDSKAMAETALASLVSSYRRTTGFF